MLVDKQRVDICNQTLMSSDQGRPKLGTYSLKTLNITVHRLRNEALLGQAGVAFRDFWEDDIGAGDGEGEGSDEHTMCWTKRLAVVLHTVHWCRKSRCCRWSLSQRCRLFGT